MMKLKDGMMLLLICRATLLRLGELVSGVSKHTYQAFVSISTYISSIVAFAWQACAQNRPAHIYALGRLFSI